MTRSDQQQVLEKVDLAILEIEAELGRHDTGSGRVSSPEQLRHIHSALHAARRELIETDTPHSSGPLRGVGRVITDSWPFGSELGVLILDAEQAYRQLRP